MLCGNLSDSDERVTHNIHTYNKVFLLEKKEDRKNEGKKNMYITVSSFEKTQPICRFDAKDFY